MLIGSGPNPGQSELALGIWFELFFSCYDYVGSRYFRIKPTLRKVDGKKQNTKYLA